RTLAVLARVLYVGCPPRRIRGAPRVSFHVKRHRQTRRVRPRLSRSHPSDASVLFTPRGSPRPGDVAPRPRSRSSHLRWPRPRRAPPCARTASSVAAAPACRTWPRAPPPPSPALAIRRPGPRRRRPRLSHCGAPVRAPPRDVQRQPGAPPGLLLERRAGQFLQRLEHLTAGAHQLPEILSAVDADDRPAGFHVQVDVAVV